MDKLGKILKTMGYRIAKDGCSGEPSVGRLAGAAHAFAPLAAETLGSDDQPENARCRAFAHIVRAVEVLSPAEREALVMELAPTAGDTERVDDPVRRPTAPATVRFRSGACGAAIPA